ncbi:MAG: hypothetical protein LBR17_05025 [Bacteroidales bacterium]|jgi:hypothetical protein|nr:hypothetical protein [Bacteroidales bacterium]
MKRIFLFTAISVTFCLSGFAQQDSIDGQRTHYEFSTGMGGGIGFWGEKFTSTDVSLGVSHQINKDLRLRFFASTGSFNSTLTGNYEDKAPYRNPLNRQAAAVGMDYKINTNLQLSVTAYFDCLNLGSMNNYLHTSRLTTAAFNANLTYKFRNDSFLNLNVTFMETNNPYNMLNPYNMDSFGWFSPMNTPKTFLNSSIWDW